MTTAFRDLLNAARPFDQDLIHGWVDNEKCLIAVTRDQLKALHEAILRADATKRSVRTDKQQPFGRKRT